MNGSPLFTVKRVGWNEAGAQLRAIRTTVFIDEQNVPMELEWDGLDGLSTHVLAITATGVAIGAGRLLPDGHIGRMAVVKPWRNRGVGRTILLELLAIARERGFERVELSAQTHAIAFYARFGFEVVGGEFMDAGIPHRTMRVQLLKPRRG